MVPRRRKDKHLPSCMYHRHGRYWYVQGGKWHKLSKELPTALTEYARYVEPPSGGMDALIDRVLMHVAPRLKPNTVKQYQLAADRLKKILAEFSPEQVRPKHIAAIKNHFAETPNMGNRVISFLRTVFNYAVEWQMVDANPCIGIRRHPEKKRDRYITDAEYAVVKAAGSPVLGAIMDICYLTGQRIGDVLAIRYSDITADGILFTQEKTGKRLIVRMTPDLRAAIERAKKCRRSTVRGFTLFHTRGGRPYAYSTVRDMLRRATAKAGVDDFHLHDLRAKSLTEAKRQGLDPQKLAGHEDAKMTDRYIRLREIDVADPPSFGQQ